MSRSASGKPRRLAFAGLAVVIGLALALALAEVMTGALKGQELEAFCQQMIPKQAKARQVLASGADTPLQTVFAYHPYYAYANSRLANQTPANYYHVDQYGFRNDFDYRQPPPGVRQVGFFGGSAAFGWSVDSEHTIAKCLERRINAQQPQTWRVVNFGVGGWHLPQQLFVLLRELPNLDGAVFYDGVNELAFCVKDAMKSRFPPDFPLYDARTFFPAPEEEDKRSSVRRLYQAQAGFAAGSWLSRSSLYLFFSRMRLQALEAEADRLAKHKPALPPETVLEQRPPAEMGFEQAVQAALADYRRYALAADAMTGQAGKKMLHVLQPQMFAGLTPGQVAEKWGKSLEHVTATYDPWYWEYHRLSRLYQETWGGQGGGLGPQALDLSRSLPVDFAFESWWTDPVHTRRQGNEVIARGIYDKMVAAGWFPEVGELAPLAAVDLDNRGSVEVELSCQPCKKQAAEGARVTWLVGQRRAGQGPQARVTLPVGRNLVFAQVEEPGGRQGYFRQEVTVAHNLAALNNLASGARANSNDQNSRPELAIDGNTAGKGLDEVWCTSSPSRRFFWELDLGRTRQVRALEIFFRADHQDPDQVSHLRVLGSLEPDFARASVLGSRGAGPFPADRRWVIYLPDQPLRHIRIQRDTDHYLALAEVRVLGEGAQERP